MHVPLLRWVAGLMAGPPILDRRQGSDRRQRSGADQFWHLLGSPVSVIMLVGSLVLSVVTVVRNANGALQAATYYEAHSRDSLTTYYREAARDQQFLLLQSQLSDLKSALGGDRARQDSVIRLLRRSVCRTTPDDCP